LNHTSSGSEEQLKSAGEEHLQKSLTTFNGSLAEKTSELNDLHETVMSELSVQCRNMNKEIEELAKEVSETLSNTEQSTRSQSASLRDAYNEKCMSGYQPVRSFTRNLRVERATLVKGSLGRIDVHTKDFEKQLENCLQRHLDSCAEICDDAEDAVSGAQASCASESKVHGREKQAAIDKAMQDF